MKTLKIGGVRYTPFEQMYDRQREGSHWNYRLHYRATVERVRPAPVRVCDDVEFVRVKGRRRWR